MKRFILIILTIAACACIGLGTGICARTLCSPWWFAAIAVAMAWASWPWLKKTWPRLLPGKDAWIYGATHTLIVGGILFLAVPGINYAGCSDTSEVEATVVARHWEERQRQRRVRGRYVPTGDKYKVYYLDYGLPDGKTFSSRVSPHRYASTRTGSTVTVHTARGLLGIAVIRDREL